MSAQDGFSWDCVVCGSSTKGAKDVRRWILPEEARRLLHGGAYGPIRLAHADCAAAHPEGPAKGDTP